jgi:hypothetical protein
MLIDFLKNRNPMEKYSEAEMAEALKVISSTISNCEKM